MKDIKGYEGLYAVTSCGKVWSYYSKRFLKGKKKSNGYIEVCLTNRFGETEFKYVHRLVLETYCPVENMDKLQANHKSEIKKENYLNNLEWLTPKENANYGTRNKRRVEKISKIVEQFNLNETFVAEYPSSCEASRQTGVTQSSISQCCNGKRKTAGGYIWRYK